MHTKKWKTEIFSFGGRVIRRIAMQLKIKIGTSFQCRFLFVRKCVKRLSMRKIVVSFFAVFVMLYVSGCAEKNPSILKTYKVHTPVSSGDYTFVRYYEMSDGTWRTDDCSYQYKLEITGRMGGAVKDSTFVFLSNRETISFEQAWKASGLSSDSRDYFEASDARFVGMKLK